MCSKSMLDKLSSVSSILSAPCSTWTDARKSSKALTTVFHSRWALEFWAWQSFSCWTHTWLYFGIRSSWSARWPQYDQIVTPPPPCFIVDIKCWKLAFLWLTVAARDKINYYITTSGWLFLMKITWSASKLHNQSPNLSKCQLIWPAEH